MKKDENISLLKEEDLNTDRNPDEQLSNVLSTIKGLIATILYTILLGVSKISVQALDRSIPDFELNALRCGFAMVCMGLYYVITKTPIRVSKENILSVVLVSIATTLSTLGTYVSATFTPLASGQSVIITCSLLSGLIIFTLVNKENPKCDKLIAVPVCITGVVLVLQPDFIFGNVIKRQDQSWNVTSNLCNSSCSNDFSENVYQNQNVKAFSNSTKISAQNQENTTLMVVGYIIAVITGLNATIRISILKNYKSFFTTENIFKSLLWIYILGTVLSLISMVIYEHPVLPGGLKEILLVMVHVSTYVLVTPLALYGFQHISGNLSSIMKTSVILYLLAAQYTILKDIHPGHRNWIEILGVILVLFGTIFSSVVEIVNGFRTQKRKLTV